MNPDGFRSKSLAWQMIYQRQIGPHGIEEDDENRGVSADFSPSFSSWEIS